MKLRAPEDVVSAQVDGVDFEVDSTGHVEVENTDHIKMLRALGFTDEDATVAPTIDVENPNFEVMTRAEISAWLADKGVAMASNTSKLKMVEVAEKIVATKRAEAGLQPDLNLEPEPVVEPEVVAEPVVQPDPVEAVTE